MLSVISDPPGAEVFLDGQRVGTTPLEGARLTRDVRHKVAVKAGESVWERELPASPPAPNVIYVETDETPAGGFRSFDVAAPPGAAVYVNGAKVGTGTLTLHLATPRFITLVAAAKGVVPRRDYIWPWSESAPTYSFSLDTPADGVAGPAETPSALTPPQAMWADPNHAFIEVLGPITPLPASDGLVALLLPSGKTQSIVAYKLAPGGGSAVDGKVLVSWRTYGIGEEPDGTPFSQEVVPFAWREGKLFFLAPEPRPDGDDPGLLGLGLWEVDAENSRRHRLAWLPTWSVHRGFQEAWITGDGRAAVVHTWDPDFSYFHVIDLATAKEEVYRTRLPYYEPGGCTVYYRSPDGWRVAYGPNFGPREGAVMVLGLDRGEERRVFETAPGGLFDRVTWSPDGTLLAVASADKGENYFVAEGEDGSALFPSKFVVVDLKGERVAEISVPGEMLDFTPGWSPDSRYMAVQAMTVARNATPDPSGETWALRRGPVYVGRVGEALRRVTAAGEDLSTFRVSGLIAADRLLLAGQKDDREVTSFRNLSAGTKLDIPGYTPAHSYDWNSGLKPLVVSGGRVLLYGERSGNNLALLSPDGSVALLNTGDAHPYRYTWEDPMLMCEGWREDYGRVDFFFLGGE